MKLFWTDKNTIQTQGHSTQYYYSGEFSRQLVKTAQVWLTCQTHQLVTAEMNSETPFTYSQAGLHNSRVPQAHTGWMILLEVLLVALVESGTV